MSPELMSVIASYKSYSSDQSVSNATALFEQAKLYHDVILKEKGTEKEIIHLPLVFKVINSLDDFSLQAKPKLYRIISKVSYVFLQTLSIQSIRNERKLYESTIDIFSERLSTAKQMISSHNTEMQNLLSAANESILKI